MTGPSSRQAARLAHVRADIEDVERQVEDHELDEHTAQELIARYRAEIDALDHEPDGHAPPPVTSPRRIVGALLLIGSLISVSIVAFGAIRPRQGGFVTGGSTDGIDLDSVTNDQMESVIAANADIPQVAGMRIALADRYFDELAHSNALDHYLAALEGRLDASRRARALARIGWMSFVAGRPDLAEIYLGEALETDAGYNETHLFLGLVRLDECDPRGALEELEPLAADERVPLEIRADIEVATSRARQLISTGACP